MRISLVVASTATAPSARTTTLPWRLPDDLKRFKALTLGKPILMGRKTADRSAARCPAVATWC